MKREDHETLLNELLDSGLEQSRRTEILQQLRVDYNNVTTEFGELTENTKKLQLDNSDLVLSNSKLFRQLGVTGTPEEPKEKQKDFSESITIEALEKL
jgi:regulator of replication initiation timing